VDQEVPVGELIEQGRQRLPHGGLPEYARASERLQASRETLGGASGHSVDEDRDWTCVRLHAFAGRVHEPRIRGELHLGLPRLHHAERRALVSELRLDDKVTFLGFKSDVKPYVADFDVAIVPSVYPDPLPRAVIESMALGKPVIAFDVGGVAEMLEQGVCGALVRGSPPDVPGLAAEMLRYARDAALRARNGGAARARIERDFDSRTQAKRIQDEIVRASG
jgi:glycosyltransferase involved in cell wall biosynthesis